MEHFMEVENTSGERPSLSIAEAAEKLRQSREAARTPAPEPEVAEEAEDQAEAETEAEDEPEAEAEEIETDDPEAEADDESEPEDDDDPDALYEVAGETFTLSELREWKKNGLRQADYTKKTQAHAEEVKRFQAERQTWEAERSQIVDHFKRQDAQLREALATFAIEQPQKPKRSDFQSTDAYLMAVDKWEDGQSKRVKAREELKRLNAQQHQQVIQRETEALLRHFPEWRDEKVYAQAATEMVKTANEYGITPEEMASITDHRMFRVLNDLVQLRAKTNQGEAAQKAAAKKVAKAAKPLAPGAKPNVKNQTDKELRRSRERLKQTGSISDAVAVMRARRSQA